MPPEVNKPAIEKKDPGSLPVVDKVPRSKLAIPPLALKFLGKISVFLYAEGLGRRRPCACLTHSVIECLQKNQGRVSPFR